MVIADFSENFSFVVQDGLQSFHWNNLQATVHPFVCYFNDDRGQLANLCYVIISECTTHDTVAVHLFQSKLLQFLTGMLEVQPSMIFYVSHGCAAQYKNFLNLSHHEADFGMPAEWHFFATSHGKSACDGARGTLKRIVTKASLQRPYDNHILTTKDLYVFASQNIKGMDFAFASNEEHYEEMKRLEPRFSNCRTNPGTQRLHSFKPVSENTLEVRMFSCDATARREKVTCSVKETISNISSSLSSYVTVAYEEHCWIGCILHTNLMENTVTIIFLHPHLNAPSYIFPDPPDIIDVDPTDILSYGNPTTTGRRYTLPRKEEQLALKALQESKL